ncbi:MAG: choice-of-anchor tandem repeat GloVer-containing protein, partial [Bacteroidota bacterium]
MLPTFTLIYPVIGSKSFINLIIDDWFHLVIRNAKRSILIFTACFLLSNSLQAQNFFGTMEERGGVIFSIDNNDRFSVLHTFGSNPEVIKANGEEPYSTLLWNDNKLWGTTHEGGENGSGVIFSINPDGTDYKVHYHFTGADGANPQGALIVDSNGLLWGMTENGGEDDHGVIFTFDRSRDTNNNAYSVIHYFNPSNTINDDMKDGSSPRSALTLANSRLWGVTFEGGNYDEGVIFSIDEVTKSDYQIGYSWSPDDDGANPLCDLVIEGERLLGTVTDGGLFNDGLIFSIKSDHNDLDFTVQAHFNGENGKLNPRGRLTKVDNIWWGVASGEVTSEGVIADDGAIFNIDIKENVIEGQHDFNGTNGTFPVGGLAKKGDFLYGMTRNGGEEGRGVAFKIHKDGSDFSILKHFGTDSFPGNPQNSGLIWIADNIAPTLDLVSIASNNSNDTTLAKTGDMVTLIFRSSENLQETTVMVRIADQQAVISGSGTEWTATYQFTGSEGEGVVAFTIDAKDTYGNPLLQQVTATTDESFVVYDKTVMITSSDEVNVDENTIGLIHTATADEIVTFEEIESNDDDKLTITVNGEVRWEGSFSPDFENPKDSDKNGIYELCIRATDAAGNTTDQCINFDVQNVDETGPGDVEGTVLWFRADQSVYNNSAGTTIAADGDMVAHWGDRSGNGYNAYHLNPGNEPIFASNSINGNPSLTFDRSDSDKDYLPISGLNYDNDNGTTPPAISMFTVLKTTLDLPGIILSYDASEYFRFSTNYDGNESYGLIADGPPLHGQSEESDGIPHLLGASYNPAISGSNNKHLYFDGSIDTTKIVGNPSFGSSNTRYGFIGVGSEAIEFDGVRGPAQHFGGNIAEIVYYEKALTDMERQKVESYLAIKYGITLHASVSYLSSNNTVIWDADDNAGYANDIAGIGRDDESVLDQRASMSVNADAMVRMDKSGSFDTDLDFIVWGNDDGSSTFEDNDVDRSRYEDRLGRVWKVSTTSSPGSVTVTVAIPGASRAASSYVLIKDSDATFSDVGSGLVASSISDTTLTFNNVSFSGNEYFTVARVDDTNPEITSSDSVNVDENTTGLIHTATANESVTYAEIGGTDRDKLTITPEGEISWEGGFSPDFENPEDSNGDGVYELCIQATDVAGNKTEQCILFVVQDVDDTNPENTSSDSVNVDENTTGLIHTATANES